MNIEELQNKEYFTIGEVSKLCGIPEYTIRYWEKTFNLLRPIRKESRHRRYTKKDLEIISTIKELTQRHKMTLEGAKKHLTRYMGWGAKPKNSSGGYTIKDVNLLKEIKETLSQIIKEC